jgi:hypothetical protein
MTSYLIEKETLRLKPGSQILVGMLESVEDIVLMVSTIIIVGACCAGVLINSFYSRRTRPREDSGESLV